MFAMHGSLYLAMKTEGDLQARVRRLIPRLMVVFFVLNTLVVIGTVLFREQITTHYLDDIWPVIFPAAALVALIAAWLPARAPGREFAAFVASAAMIALLLISGAVGHVPEPADLDDRSGVQPDDLQRGLGGQHARGVLIVA